MDIISVYPWDKESLRSSYSTLFPRSVSILIWVVFNLSHFFCLKVYLKFMFFQLRNKSIEIKHQNKFENYFTSSPISNISGKFLYIFSSVHNLILDIQFSTIGPSWEWEVWRKRNYIHRFVINQRKQVN